MEIKKDIGGVECEIIMKSIDITHSVAPLVLWLRSIDLRQCELFALELKGCPEPHVFDLVEKIMFKLIDYFGSMPYSMYKLKRFAFYCNAWYVMMNVVLKLDSLKKPLAVALDWVSPDHLNMFLNKIQNIRRVYCAESVYFFSEASISSSNVISIGEIASPKAFREKNETWSWKVEMEPRDKISIAEAILAGYNPPLDKICPKLAYALRVNRDRLNQMRTVCTLIMLGKYQKQSPLSILNKDCVNLILSYLSVQDWDLPNIPKLTHKTSKWAEQLVKLAKNDQRNSTEETRAALQEFIQARKKINQGKIKKDKKQKIK